MVFRIAETIGLPACLVRELPVSEVHEWGQWFALKAKWEKDAARKAKGKGRRR